MYANIFWKRSLFSGKTNLEGAAAFWRLFYYKDLTREKPVGGHFVHCPSFRVSVNYLEVLLYQPGESSMSSVNDHQHNNKILLQAPKFKKS